jgi:AcrR family transcriptional regulator
MRARFTVAEIGAAALEIVDRQGLEGLSMRSLANALGTGPMTVYNYVKNRDELEELVAEAIIGDVKLPAKSADWRADTAALATALWHGVRRHPNAIPLVLTRRTLSSSSYAGADRLIEAMGRGGLVGVDLLAAFRAVLSLIMGSAQAELARPRAGVDRDREQAAVAARIGGLAGTEHPHIAALAQISQQSTAGADFERGLGFLLDGLAGRAGDLANETIGRRS